MSVSKYNVTLHFVDIRGNKTTVTHPIDTPTNVPFAALDVAAAELHTNELAEKYAAVTDAKIYKVVMGMTTVESDDLGAMGSDVSNEMQYQVYTNPDGTFPKLATLRIPSPHIDIFQPDLITLDLNNADFNALVDEIDAGVFISDGEQINGNLGTNGVKSGQWVSKARKAKV